MISKLQDARREAPTDACNHSALAEWSQFPHAPDRWVVGAGPWPTLAGFICGLTMGAAVGVLITPRSGRDNRRWMAEQGATVKRRTTAMLHPEWVSIVRRRGVLGLLEGTGPHAAPGSSR